MSTVVKTLEPLLDLTDIPIGPFVYVAPADEGGKRDGHVQGHGEVNNGGKIEDKESEKKEDEQNRNRNQNRNGHRHKRRFKSIRSRAVYSDTTLYKTLGTNLYYPKN